MIQPNDSMIETPGLNQSIGDVQALQGVDLSKPRHSIFGFLKPQRGSKSVLKKVLLSLIRQTTDQGSIISQLPVIGSVGLIISHCLFCLTFILMALFSFRNTEF